MRPALFAAVVSAVAALAAPAFAGDPTGLWQTPTNGGQVRISRCGQALCGVLVTSASIRANPSLTDEHNSDRALRSRPLRNLPMLRGFTGGPTEWTGGSVYNPADGRTYSGSITMQGEDTLRLRGCVVAPLCRTQTWTRIQ
ncbi:DUF2147 domain-containing protein [Brevundimonas sp. Root1279]|uniref:DUF2147 domain-containing protein n=1 Tax=Brevundimonas sp. Root1279 TaxID=1736443 RepID=UPI000700DFFD|nr:DUF2147 domain-containing protein [Brevundimonas sp. Root1279]KQW83917.1 hypothetical protein ASC65_04615 [Brevundimonas sp. Root1279]